MKTELISLQEYRKNISTLWKKANQEDIKYIVMVHSNPVLEIIPIRKREIQVETLTPKETKELNKIREKIKLGKLDDFITLDERKQKNAKNLGVASQQRSRKISR